MWEINKQLAFTWKGPVPFADLMNISPLPTSVKIDFEDKECAGTAVVLTHAGWGAGTKWQAARTWQENAWIGAFTQLKELLER